MLYGLINVLTTTALIKIKQALTYTLQIYNNISAFLLYMLIPYYIVLLMYGATTALIKEILIKKFCWAAPAAGLL